MAKKVSALLLVVFMLLGILTACGTTYKHDQVPAESPAASDKPAESATPAEPESTPEPAPQPTPEPTPQPTPEPAPQPASAPSFSGDLLSFYPFEDYIIQVFYYTADDGAFESFDIRSVQLNGLACKLDVYDHDGLAAMLNNADFTLEEAGKHNNGQDYSETFTIRYADGNYGGLL